MIVAGKRMADEKCIDFSHTVKGPFKIRNHPFMSHE